MHSPIPETMEERFCKELELEHVECEFSCYEDADILLKVANTPQRKEFTFPLLFRVTMDVLHVQVSCAF